MEMREIDWSYIGFIAFLGMMMSALVMKALS